MTAIEYSPLRYRYDAAGRPPIIEAARQTVQAYIQGQPCIGHDLPPRIGKSTLIHILAVELRALGAPFVHTLVPWTNLSRQLTDAAKVTANLDRVQAEGYEDGFSGQAITAIDSARYWQRKNNSPCTLITSTVHLANHHSRNVENAIKLSIELTGKRPVVIVDEVHLLALGQKWANTLLAFQEAGAFVVTMTGTSERTDDACILGFTVEPKSDWVERTQRVVTYRGEPYKRDADGLLVRDVKGEDRTYQQRESITKATGCIVGWDEAFANMWMHPAGPQPQDFKVVVDGEPVSIAEVSKDAARKNLGKWMRSAECCRQLAVKGVEWLSTRRSDERMKHTKILAVTTADIQESSEKEINAHAREMRRQLESAIADDPLLARQDLNVEICTSVNENGEADDKAAEKLYRFGLTKTDDNGKEPIDILIVKGMGLVGLDVPECKILLDASTIRQGPLKRQLATRPLTVWKLSDGTLAPEAQIAYPSDILNSEFYQSLAATSKHGKEKQGENSTSFEDVAEIKEPELPIEILDGSGENAGYQDEAGKWARGDHDRLIARIHATWPETLSLRRITLIEMYQSGAFPDEKMKPVEELAPARKKRQVVDLSAQLANERGGDGSESFGQKARRLANDRVEYSKNPLKWRKLVTRLQSLAKRKSFVSPDEPVDRIQDPEILRQLKKALDEVEMQAVNEVFG